MQGSSTPARQVPRVRAHQGDRRAELKCWGLVPGNGGLGNGTTSGSNVPIDVIAFP